MLSNDRFSTDVRKSYMVRHKTYLASQPLHLGFIFKKTTGRYRSFKISQKWVNFKRAIASRRGFKLKPNAEAGKPGNGNHLSPSENSDVRHFSFIYT